MMERENHFQQAGSDLYGTHMPKHRYPQAHYINKSKKQTIHELKPATCSRGDQKQLANSSGDLLFLSLNKDGGKVEKGESQYNNRFGIKNGLFL